MNGFLKQSTSSQVRKIGPFIDSVDFVSVENSLTIANTDIRLSKNGGASAAKNSGGATADGNNGMYAVTWDSTDTNTVGELHVSVLVSGALIVWATYVVLEEAVYDQLYVAAAPGAATPTQATAIETDTQDLQARTPAALVSGRMDASVGAMAANVLTATAINADAITAAKVAADVGTEIGTAVWATAARTVTAATNITSTGGTTFTQTGDAFVRLGAPVGASTSADIAAVKAQTAAIEADTQDVQARLPAALVSGRMSSDAVAISGSTAAADALEANIVFLDTNVSSRLATVGYTTPPTAGANADAVWDEAIAGHLAAGSTGAALNAAGSAGDPWTTLLPGAYGAGTAGQLIGDNVNATISSRLASASYTTPPTAIENADALLKRDMSSVTGEAARSPLNAMRFHRNRFTIIAGTLTVYEEDDTTVAWTGAVTQTAGNPVSEINPT